MPGLMSTLMGLIGKEWKMAAVECTSDTQTVTVAEIVYIE